MLKIWRTLLALLIGTAMFGVAIFPAASALAAPTANSTVITVSVDKAAYKVGQAVAVTVTFSGAAGNTTPVDVIVTIPNPNPAVLKIDKNSISGAASYVAAAGSTPEEVVSARDTLNPGSLPFVIKFNMYVEVLPAGSKTITVVANLADAVQPGTLPINSGSANFNLLPVNIYLPKVNK